MDGLVAAHLIALGFWGGTVLVELTFEFGGMREKLDREGVAWLHSRVDRFIELPLLFAVVLTGALLWRRTGFDTSLLPKIACGLAAVLINVACYAVVERRAAKGWTPRDTRFVFLTAALGAPLAVAALVMGGLRAGWWG